MICPTCRKAVDRAAAGKAFPFCSSRCALIDLGKWLGEEYRIGAGDEDGEAARAAAASPPRDVD